MDVFRRFYRILRSNIPSDNTGGEPDWQRDDWEPEAAEEAAETNQDPELARYYANLEIPYGSDLDTARRAWKRMMKKYHPDRHAQDPEKRRLADDLTAELTQAFQEIERRLAKKENN